MSSATLLLRRVDKIRLLFEEIEAQVNTESQHMMFVGPVFLLTRMVEDLNRAVGRTVQADADRDSANPGNRRHLAFLDQHRRLRMTP